MIKRRVGERERQHVINIEKDLYSISFKLMVHQNVIYMAV